VEKLNARATLAIGNVVDEEWAWFNICRGFDLPVPYFDSTMLPVTPAAPLQDRFFAELEWRSQ
jgi:hypothetical protein